ncbi:MAG: S1 RNA-binding domain-containing protein [Anaerolineae bacterium]|nr:S1 RNA-binding domain-containing protein [Anaerolineae bacterium]
MEHIDTARMAEEQVSDAPNTDAGPEASQQVNSTVVPETSTGEPVDQATEDMVSEEIDVFQAETQVIVEEGGDVAFIDETVTEMVDEHGNPVTVDETITDVVHADGSETIIDEIVTVAADEAGDVAIVDETIVEEIDADGDVVVSDEIITDVVHADGSETITDEIVVEAVDEAGVVAVIEETIVEEIDADGNVVVSDETVTDVILADGSETITDEIVTTVADEAGDVAIVDETIVEEIDAGGDVVVSDEVVTDVILADGSETITDEVVAVAADEAGDVAIVEETMVAEIDADGHAIAVDETVTTVIDAAGDVAVVDEVVAAEIDSEGDVAIVDAVVAEVVDADGVVAMQEESVEVALLKDESGGQAAATMADFVGDFEFKPLKSGETRDGIIVSISTSEILVDVGAKSEGFILQREMERHGREYVESYEIGDSVVVYVVRPEDRDGNVVLSLARAQQERDWREAERLLEESEIFESQVIGHNRGGVICRVGKVRGFVPASQLVSKPEVAPDTDEESRWAGLVGENLWLKVVEMDRKRNRLILSERLAARERRRDRKRELLNELKKGDVREGRISSLAKFGAFVDLGGADGLIHLSELSWSRVNHPSEVVSPGQTVEVYVLNVDRERKRIGLSLRRLHPEPWSVVHEKYAVGQIVDGVITKLANFGAFARVDGTLEGLIHISELANYRVSHPREVVKEGEELKLRIVRIDPARKRMGLSLKRVEEDAYAEVDWRTGNTDDDEDVDWVDGDDFDD